MTFYVQPEHPVSLLFNFAIVLRFLPRRVLCSGAVLLWLRVSIKWSSTLDFVRESSTKSFPNQVLSLAPIGWEILPLTNERPCWSCISQSGEVAVTRAAAITAPQPGEKRSRGGRRRRSKACPTRASAGKMNFANLFFIFSDIKVCGIGCC